MSEIEKEIQKFVDEYRNSLILDYGRTVRLLGWTDSFNDDYYYIVLKRIQEFSTISFHSCVGQLFPLKGKLDSKDYKEIERVSELNFMGKKFAITYLHKYQQENNFIVK